MNLHQRALLRSSLSSFAPDMMRSKQHRLQPGWTSRAVTLKPSKDPDNIRWIIATEQPALVYDWELDRVVNEVLLVDGVKFPANGQLPLLDCHNRWTVDDQMGSVTDFQQTTAGEYIAIDGRVRFAADEKSARTKQKVLDGHLTDGSAGYKVLSAIWIPDDVEVVVRGRTFAGPLKVSTEWTLKEFTLTPIGADSLSKYLGQAGRLAQQRLLAA
jgi:hypothetical protein